MKKLVSLLLSVSFLCSLSSCGNEDHTGQAITPAGSSLMKGCNYTEVIDKFTENGFTNVKTEKIEDLITGWLTEDGEVEEVSVGGDTEYSPDKWVSADIEVIIKYHTFPEDYDSTSVEIKPEPEPGTEIEKPEENLTIENCPELNEILSIKSELDDRYIDFGQKYAGRIIEFDGRIDYCALHGDYSTRYDFLLGVGDYNPNHASGPIFKFEDVNYSDLNTDLESVGMGINVHIIAKVDCFNETAAFFELTPVSVTGR